VAWVLVYNHQNLDPKTAVHFLDSSQHYWLGKIYGQMLEVIVKRVFEAEFLIYDVIKSYRGFFLMIYKFFAKKRFFSKVHFMASIFRTILFRNPLYS
jgi:hypothetical protein